MWGFGGSDVRKQRYLDAVTASHARFGTCWHRDLSTGVRTKLAVVDGTVTVDRTAACRRTLSLTLPPDPAVWTLLGAPGGEITASVTIRYVDASSETIPLGVFIVDQAQYGQGPGGTITVTAPDRWLKVQRNMFGKSRASVGTNTTWHEVQRLVEGAWPAGGPPFPGWARLDTTATAKVGQIVWSDGSRENAVNGLLAASGLEMFFDQTGLAVLRPVPQVTNTTPSVYRMDVPNGSIVTDASRTRDFSQAHNAVVVWSTATNVNIAPQEAHLSGTDPLSVTGPLGYVPLNVDSASTQTAGAALALAQSMLPAQTGAARQLTVTTSGNAALDVEDVVTLIFPARDVWSKPTVEIAMIDSVTHPLGTGTQRITFRATRSSSG